MFSTDIPWESEKDDLNIIRNLMNNLKLRFKVKYRSTPNFVNVEIWLD